MIQTGNAVFTGSKAVPVLLLLDVSGSMNDDKGAKINNLNNAVAGMIDFLKKDAAHNESFYIVGIITFGGDDAKKILPFTDVNKINWKPMTADGGTPLGKAFKMAKDMIEAKEDKAVTGRCYVATVVLVSDGLPTDNIWEKTLDAFIGEGRTQKCDRWAMGIGSDVDEKMLRRFAKPKEKPGDPEKYVCGAAPDIAKFFEKVSQSVSMVSVPAPPPGPMVKGGLGGGVTVESDPDDSEQV
ncbi:MAG: VWA domain-containing protein [Treponema sp.]|jgi:uncharacterized protein YegL|nr:VWA domain-containing protein [Treponema sp.]